MTQNTENQTGQQNQADFNKSQQAGGGEGKQGQQDQTLSQNKGQGDQNRAGQEDKTFQTQGKADQGDQQYAQGSDGGSADQQNIKRDQNTDTGQKTTGV